ncbi:Glycolate dehydrogenase, iron-sulfur subunit GlcF [Grimontia indica]|uniref:Glycolate oxidase iron-sulfur subunit n=1 Tax=Grimontia indica TaxID=1056512 RepID=R1GZ80_9GAMM|nr:glycolate oxidase subunit GlcF [Grimontia indica]EOD81473.1 Glycolate dehydrogenase, iron-sulfur subunit GlcF [Grimontia indica]
MKTSLKDEFLSTLDGKKAEEILRRCVNCGFCNATCPTYQELSDERDGPRGRIYLIKQMLENGEATEKTRTHLDRCLTCRSCETTCPSGVEYSQLLDIGKQHIEKHVPRSFSDRILRYGVTRILPNASWNKVMFRLARQFTFLMPNTFREQIPTEQPLKSYPSATKTNRTMIAFRGCVQQTATPNTVKAAKAVLSHLGIELIEVAQEGCCGAVNLHLSEHERAVQQAKRNIDAWWRYLEHGAEAIVMSASGCGVTIKEYPQLLVESPYYRERALVIAGKAKDLSDILLAEDLTQLPLKTNKERVAVHCPCTLQHGMKNKETYYEVLRRLGVEQTRTTEDHLCCGSAGTYSLFQPELSQQLLKRKMKALSEGDPEGIVTANIGCQLHLGSKAQVPVKHWVELIAERLEN